MPSQTLDRLILNTTNPRQVKLRHDKRSISGYIERGNKIWYAENFSAYRVNSILLLLCAEAPYNFLEREIGMKREVIVG